MQETTARTKGVNPYIAGRALGHERGFFGREDILDLVATEMLSPDRNAVVLFGQRRIGKTSILLQLQRRLPKDVLLPVYFDLMDRAPVPLGAVLHELASAIASAAAMPASDSANFDDDGVYFRREFLPGILASLPEGRRLVLLMDEFDVLDLSDERQLPPAAAGRAFFPYVRRLMEGEPQLGFVFVVGRKADELSIDVKAAFKAARYKRVSVLEDKSARDLIKAAEIQGTLVFSPAAVDRVLQITSGHPYFTQLVCQLIWDEAYSRNGGNVPIVVPEDVDAVVTRAPEAGENIFEWIWDGLPPAEKVIASAIAHAAAENRQLVSMGEILEVLQRNGIRFMTRELELAPDTLVKWEMLHEEEGKYGFSIELMRRWVAMRKPVARVKDELDHVVPLADSLYQSGDGFYRRGNLENSQNLLQQALTINPNHLKGRLLLSQVCMEQGRLEDAVRELEEAYRFDEVSARHPLIRMLLLRGDELERAGEEDKALDACERVLELSPREKLALERRSSIWRRRGDRAFETDQLDSAAAAYERIGAADMLEKVAARRKKLQIDALSKQARPAWRPSNGSRRRSCISSSQLSIRPAGFGRSRSNARVPSIASRAPIQRPCRRSRPATGARHRCRSWIF